MHFHYETQSGSLIAEVEEPDARLEECYQAVMTGATIAIKDQAYRVKGIRVRRELKDGQRQVEVKLKYEGQAGNPCDIE